MMDKKKYFNSISDTHLEGYLKLPIDELESFDNAGNIRHLKYQAFKAKTELNKERNRALIEEAQNKVKEKMEGLSNLSIEALQELLLEKSPSMQLRNFEKLDKEELIKILEDYMLLDDLDEDNE